MFSFEGRLHLQLRNESSVIARKSNVSIEKDIKHFKS